MRHRDQFEPLDADERDLIDSVERGEWHEAGDARKLKDQAREYAEATIRKDKRMNIRISERDLRNLKRRALEEGIPYQTMVSMVLHKYVTGQYLERPHQIGEDESRNRRRRAGRASRPLQTTRDDR